MEERVLELEKEGGKGKEIKEARGMIEELGVKVEEMRNPPVTVEETTGGKEIGMGFSEALQMKLAETLAGGGANDITGLVRKREKPTTAAATDVGNGGEKGNVGEKRKMEESAKVSSPGKKVRVEDVEDEEG